MTDASSDVFRHMAETASEVVRIMTEAEASPEVFRTPLRRAVLGAEYDASPDVLVPASPTDSPVSPPTDRTPNVVSRFLESQHPIRAAPRDYMHMARRCMKADASMRKWRSRAKRIKAQASEKLSRAYRMAHRANGLECTGLQCTLGKSTPHIFLRAMPCLCDNIRIRCSACLNDIVTNAQDRCNRCLVRLSWTPITVPAHLTPEMFMI